MADEEVVASRIDGEIATVEIRREAALNALNADVLEGLSRTFHELRSQSGVRVVLLRGSGQKAFVAGADIKLMMSAPRNELLRFVALGQRVMREIEECPFAVIAVIQGHTLGGGLELALACDILVASSAARFGQPEVKLGLIPGFGGSQRLCQRVGIGTAKRLVLTGEPISAEDAFRVGLVDYCVAPDELEKAALDTARQIADRGPVAIAAGKRAVERFYLPAKLAGLQLEAEAFVSLFETADAREGLAAFIEKRPAKFTGR